MCCIKNKIRALVLFVLAVTICVESLVCAVKSFRTYKINTGINDGVFTATT